MFNVVEPGMCSHGSGLWKKTYFKDVFSLSSCRENQPLAGLRQLSLAKVIFILQIYTSSKLISIVPKHADEARGRRPNANTPLRNIMV